MTTEITIRRIPGFVWVQLGVLPLSWRFGSWWAIRGIVRTHALGPLRLVTMRGLGPEAAWRRYQDARCPQSCSAGTPPRYPYRTSRWT